MASSSESNDAAEGKSCSGIPKAEFLEDVESYMKKEDETAESLLRKLDEQHNKYKFMEYNLNTKKARLKAQIPDIKKSLDIVHHLQAKQDSTDPIETRFLLSDQVYAKARIPPTDKVCLWLGINSYDNSRHYEINMYVKSETTSKSGDYIPILDQANVMLEYNVDDAQALLSKNEEAASKSLNQVEEELSYITDQTTTLEVNMARVYNWDVKRRQAEQANSKS